MYKHDPAGDPGDSLYHVDDAPEEQHELHTWETEYVASGGERKDAGVRLVREIAAIFANYDIHSEIIAASVRHPAQLAECMLAGADILTVPAKVLGTVADHPLSDEGMKKFAADAQVFGG
jgi:transaldolase